MKVLQILPRVPPAVCGIGDYAWRLAQALRDDHDIHSNFLAAGTNWTQPKGETEFPVFRLPELTSQALVSFVASQVDESQAVVLHMSPYGYQKRAVPFWLAAGWRRLAQLPRRPRLITMFHELYAAGPPTSSAFWLQPLQKWVLREVARASDALRTNREDYAAWLQRVSRPDTQVVVMPVFSNFGEPSVQPAWTEREPSMVLFAWGIHSGESLGSVVRKAAVCGRRFNLKRMHLIGCKQTVDEAGLGLEVVRHGFMEPAAVSALLSSCRMAYTAYSAEHFGKSTLMAAFAAHGLLVITQGRMTELPDGLKDGCNVLNESSLAAWHAVDADRLQNIATALRQWYDGHSVTENARSYAGQIRGLM